MNTIKITAPSHWASYLNGVVLDSDDSATQSMLDHWEEELLFAFDQGKRGDALTAWFYAP